MVSDRPSSRGFAFGYVLPPPLALPRINFVIITTTLCIQLKQTRERPPKYYKNNCFRELFCNNFGHDGTEVECQTPARSTNPNSCSTALANLLRLFFSISLARPNKPQIIKITSRGYFYACFKGYSWRVSKNNPRKFK